MPNCEWLRCLIIGQNTSLSDSSKNKPDIIGMVQTGLTLLLLVIDRAILLGRQVVVLLVFLV
ncbi:hypothetical protein T12_14136 [Trichinella patagoniensis]|uniref:Uncharacterized protein n=1 Tax=Trichinella patagoniensis TaxID=990121 RepID=A0A0V0ZHY4_9BILA|nr:hypothetical protein T12_14136 [Trichinella patagoniensis]